MPTPTFPFGETQKQEGRFQIVLGNEPKNLPGCYGIFDLRNGKWCVGSTTNIRRRRNEHEGDVRERTSFAQAVVEAGPECFVYVPLYYFVITRKMLEELEARMITGMDSLAPNGYNAYASKKDKVYWGVMQRGHDEAFFKRRNASIARHHEDPAYREARRQDTTGRRWYNNSVEERRLPPGKEPLAEWVHGRLPVTDSHREKMRSISRESQNRPEVVAKKAEKARKQWERQSLLLSRSHCKQCDTGLIIPPSNICDMCGKAA